jgi:hypothetical protein
MYKKKSKLSCPKVSLKGKNWHLKEMMTFRIENNFNNKKSETFYVLLFLERLGKQYGSSFWGKIESPLFLAKKNDLF